MARARLRGSSRERGPWREDDAPKNIRGTVAGAKLKWQINAVGRRDFETTARNLEDANASSDLKQHERRAGAGERFVKLKNAKALRFRECRRSGALIRLCHSFHSLRSTHGTCSTRPVCYLLHSSLLSTARVGSGDNRSTHPVPYLLHSFPLPCHGPSGASGMVDFTFPPHRRNGHLRRIASRRKGRERDCVISNFIRKCASHHSVLCITTLLGGGGGAKKFTQMLILT